MSRVAKLFLLTVAGLCVFVPLTMRGHGRAAGLFFLAWIVMEFVIFLRMKPGPADFAPFRKAGQIKSAKRLRRAGYFYVVALILGLCITNYRDLHWGPMLVGLAISVGFIWFFFRKAKQLKDMPPEQWERRFGK